MLGSGSIIMLHELEAKGKSIGQYQGKPDFQEIL